MISSYNSITRITTTIAVTITIIITTSVPAAYFAITYKYKQGSIDAHAQLSAKIIEELIIVNPKMWQFEEIRLQELLQHRSNRDVPEIRVLKDSQGNIITQMTDPLSPPLIKRYYDIHDAGTIVAQIEISESLRPLLVQTAIVGAVSCLFGFLIFLVLRIIPLKAVRNAYNAMEESKEALLRSSKEKFQVIANTVTDAVIEMDNLGKIEYWNPAAEKIFGYSRDEIKGKEFHLIIAPERFHNAYRKGFSRFAKTGEGPTIGNTLEFMAVRKDGTEFPIEVSVSAIQKKGQWDAVGIVRDITERKKLEAKLIHAQKMETVGTLTGGVAHEFNNILTAIIGFASISKMEADKEDPLAYNLEQILASAERAANLVRSLLAFSKKQITNPRPLNINALVNRVEKLLLRIIGEDIQLKTALTDKDLTVVADSGQIEQVIINLATNARDAMPNGGTFTIITELAELDNEFIKAYGDVKRGTYALISVIDTGIGMDKQTKARIFEPFFTTKEVGKGTGLGLSMVYGIIQQHNGYIYCDSELGKGTTFRIYLPLSKSEKAKGVKTEKNISDVTKGGAETILLAEDEEKVRTIAKTVLEEAEYKVIEALDGEDAINKFIKNKDKVQLLLFDIIMPKMSGRAAFEKIKEIRPDMKVLFISGYSADFIHEQEILDQGLNFMAKPITPQALLKRVREVLDNELKFP